MSRFLIFIPFLIVWFLFTLFTFPIFYAGIASFCCCFVPYIMSLIGDDKFDQPKYIKTDKDLMREGKLKELEIMQAEFDREMSTILKVTEVGTVQYHSGNMNFEKVLNSPEIGNRVINEFLTDNEVFAPNATEALAMYNKFQQAKALLEIGAVLQAHANISAIEVDSFFTQERKDKYLLILSECVNDYAGF